MQFESKGGGIQSKESAQDFLKKFMSFKEENYGRISNSQIILQL